MCLLNIIKIDQYYFELYRFKVGPFLDTVHAICCRALKT